nr:glycosyltransferase [uncultured Cardiobacterium sp.]
MTIGYVLKRYPRFSETFIVNEILAHEKAGAKIRIYALGPVQETHFQEAIARVRAPVHRIRHQYHDTLLYWQHLRKAHAQLPNFDTELALSEEHDAATIGQAITLALTAREHGITHLHAHFGTQAATIARLAGHFAAIPYSFTAHAKDIYHHYAEPVNLATKIQDAAFTITVSDYNLAHLRTEYHSSAPIYRIYNGLDLDQFPYQIPRDRPPHILAVGRLVEKKRLQPPHRRHHPPAP